MKKFIFLVYLLQCHWCSTTDLQHIKCITCMFYARFKLYCIRAIKLVGVISSLQLLHKCWSSRQQREQD